MTAIHLIEDRRIILSPWGKGNLKLGLGIYTYSKLPGRISGTCPGSSGECELICYAKRLVHNKWVWELYKENTLRGDELPELPSDAKIVRFHVSGDFDTPGYIISWIRLAAKNPDVRFFGYTRSWRVPELRVLLEEFKSLPNVFLWASIDSTVENLPPESWHKAWIEGDHRIPSSKVVICPEETGKRPNCESCGFCFKKTHDMDLIFLKH